jgi:hypothetical protein
MAPSGTFSRTPSFSTRSIIRSTFTNGIEDPPQQRAEDSTPNRGGEIALTPGQKLALLVMRQSDLSKQVLAGVIARTHEGPAGRDFYSCARLGLAINKGRFHVLSPAGRRRADQACREVARAYGLHIISYNLGGRGQAAYAECTCGWRHYRTRVFASYVTLIRQDATRHLLLESAKRVSP